jgi:hypothetical protein
LDLRELLACKPFASTSIYQAPASIFHHVSIPRRFIHDFQTFWRKIVGICLRHFSKNVLIHLRSVYRVSPIQGERAPTLGALLRGAACPKDAAQARKWYEAAAAAGDASASKALGQMNRR